MRISRLEYYYLIHTIIIILLFSIIHRNWSLLQISLGIILIRIFYEKDKTGYRQNHKEKDMFAFPCVEFRTTSVCSSIN